MAFSPINNTQIQPSKAVKTELFKKIKDNFDDHETRISNALVGTSKIEIFNLDVFNSSNSASMTGLIYHKCIQNFRVTSVEIQIYEKGTLISGFLELDVKKNSTPDNTGMTSILNILPKIDFSTANDYDSNAGTLNPTLQTLTVGEFLRLDITQIPNNLSKFRIVVYGEL